MHNNERHFMQADQKKCVPSMETVSSCCPRCSEDEETFWGHAESCNRTHSRFLSIFNTRLLNRLCRLQLTHLEYTNVTLAVEIANIRRTCWYHLLSKWQCIQNIFCCWKTLLLSPT